MNTRKHRPRLLTIPDFRKERPDITESQIRFALRNRESNGFDPCVYFKAHGRRKAMLDVERTAAYFDGVVRA